MKTRLLALFLISFSLTRGYGSEVLAGDTLLNHIQKKVNTAFQKCFQNKNTNELIAIEKKLSGMKEPIAQYWNAYTLFYESLYHIKIGNKRASFAKIDQGIKVLEGIKNKGSEEYALLAYMQGFSIQFTSGMQAGIISSKVNENMEKALELDKENLRAWYIRASNNYYTPKAFGGGKLVEESLTKAIALEEKNINNPYRPTWGKDMAYGLLVSFYVDNKRMTEAKKTLEAGLKLYPQDYKLREHEKSLSGK